MFRREILLSAIAAAALSAAVLPGAAANAALPGDKAPAQPHLPGIRLAQNGEIDIYYDRDGRQVLVDR